MKIAFYAPMKSPDDAQPSGDRTIGRLLMAALGRANWDVRLASRLRTWSGSPDATALQAFRTNADQEAAALVEAYGAGGDGWRPDIWFTYHSYYKAPDLVGPVVARALGIPYVITEASYSARRASGPWSDWLAAARAGLKVADAIFSFTARDKVGLEAICEERRLYDLAPFLDPAPFNQLSADPALRDSRDPADPVRLVTVAMMRPGAKLASYKMLSAALDRLLDRRNWHLDIVGDGVARGDVERAFSHITTERLTWHGVLEPADHHHILADGDLFVWPGIEEAFGMAFLEAQASGLPVAAIRTAGVPEVVRHGETGLLAEEVEADAYAQILDRLICDAALRTKLGVGARAAINARHSISAASSRLDDVLRRLVRPV